MIKFLLSVTTASISLLFLAPIQAQIVPDRSLPEPTIVEPGQGNNIEIKGGTRPGNGKNLFHSFQKFSVLERHIAHFNNAMEVQNIFARVTGGSISNIEGTLKANGNANLFLLNPNGILFGDNASLDIGGSFFATTAESIKFADGTEFSATDAQTAPLLTISVPIGLQIENAASSINVRGATLKVPSRKTLALVGGDVNLNYGDLIALGGRVELGGLATAGTVNLNDDSSLSFPDGVTRADVSLTDFSGVDVRANGGGDISIQARNLDISAGSELLAGIAKGNMSEDVRAGDIEIDATGTVNLREGSFITNIIDLDPEREPRGNRETFGNGGDINVTTGSLNIRNGSILATSTYTKGDAGDININARDTISVDGLPSVMSSIVGLLGLQTYKSEGNAGNLNITTGSLFVTNGGSLVTSTAGEGNAGNVTINARDRIIFDGAGNSDIPSNISSTVGLLFPERIEGQGKGGNITINTDSLTVRNGAFLATGSILGEGDAGDITIHARGKVAFEGVRRDGSPSAALSAIAKSIEGRGGNINITANSLSVTDGAILYSSTLGFGNAGNINLKITDSVEISGANLSNRQVVDNPWIDNLKTIFGSNILNSSTGLYSSTGSTAEGRGGEIRVDARVLRLTDEAIINAQPLNVNDGGNIFLTIRDLLLLRRNSNISTTAGTAITGGNGGNIDIDADFIVAFPGENSNITANAFEGEGGEIDISTLGIFGLQERQATPATNDIDASSQSGISGTVSIVNPEVDPTAGVIELPTTLVDAETLISQNVCAVEDGKIAGGSSFVVTGRGGLPPSADDPVTNAYRIVEWATRTSETQRSESNMIVLRQPPINENGKRIHRKIEQARGWGISSDGTLVLTAQAPKINPQPPQLSHPQCRDRS